jgi:ATP-binding cassette subfamily F protein 1
MAILEAEEEAAAAALASKAPVVKQEVVEEKPKKLSKLQQKMQRAKLEKAERDAADAAARAAAGEPEPEAEESEEVEEKEATTVVVEYVEERGPAKPNAKKKEEEVEELTEAMKEARMMSTLYGDDVHSEWGRPVEDSASNGGKKLSNRERRKAEKEKEAVAREAEYQKVLMKRSMEGAQFACSQSIIKEDDPQWMNALDIQIPSVSISAHSKELFVNTEFNIAHGRHYGLVGPNGAGKSTLLKMIAAGELKLPPRIDFLYVEQEVVADETPAVESVLRADRVRWDLLQEEKQIMAEINKHVEAGVKSPEALDVRLGAIHEELSIIDSEAAEPKARRILFGLGFDVEMQSRPTKYFSGGWRMRISLARALFIEPTLLMLDEPTNHLDLNAVIWLDDYLQRWKKTLLVVSHDQDFLNSVCQEILHLENKKIVVYRGNYDTFKEQEAIRHKVQCKEYIKQEKRLKELKSKGATGGMSKKAAEDQVLAKKKREPGARGKKEMAKAVASGGIESNEGQTELIKRPKEYTVKFNFPEVTHLTPPILEVKDVNFQYGPNLPWLFKGLNFGLDMDSRVCIVGPNGSGKSTIIKLITERVNPPEGEVRRNPRLRIGVYDQHFVDRLPMDEDPVSYLRRLFGEETYQSCRNILGRYGLEGHAHCIPMRDLSGGQKARVVMVELGLMAPHLLFLDEPTNNLDIESIDALCDALKAYNGGVVVVSHDARLIETVECQLWVVEDRNVTPWVKGFADYRQHLLTKLEEQMSAIIAGGGETQVVDEKIKKTKK